MLSAIVTGLLGLVVGWLLWGNQTPDPIEALAPTKAALADAAEAIDVVTAHAEFAASAGTSTPDYAGSPEALVRARSAVEGASPVLAELDPEALASIERQLDELDGLLTAKAPPADVIAASTSLAADLRATLGGS